MDKDRAVVIEDLVAEALERIETQGSSALEELYAEHPDSADALRMRVEWLLETGLAQVAMPEPRDYPERLGDFRLIEPIGEGGMGVVYRAEQISLRREVALKLVRPEQLYFPGAHERFQHEVTTVAGLAHPGIVPVYAVGQEDGVPFFAMERVRGASLGAVVADLEGRDPRELSGADLLASLDSVGADPHEEPSSLFDGPWPTVCARIVREVAEALEHAHRRGVLHRDVKPSNVMLTRGGRVMLVDFGLSSQESVEERRTKTGQRVGTLAYMAPEQMRGERELDARTDVFALGVALYELLVLRLPYDASSEADRLAKAGVAVPANLRKIDPRIPWELETVVQTAADPDPARRYASAADFARDLDNVLESRPIEARRSSPLLRARRWVQRNPAAALATLVVVVAPSVMAVQELRANAELREKSDEVQAANIALGAALDDATHQREVADAARERAEQHFERTYEAIELMLGRVGGEVLEGVPRMEPIRRELLTDALRLHEELLHDPAVDDAQTQFYARTLHRTAALHAELGQLEPALDALGREAEVLDALIADDAPVEVRRERALVDYRRGQVSKLLGELDAAERFGRLAVEQLVAVNGAEPGDENAWALATAHIELAEALIRAGSSEPARVELRTAVSLLRPLVASEAATWKHKLALAKALHWMAGSPASFIVGPVPGFDTARAEEYLWEALDLQSELVDEDPDNATALRGVGETALTLGNTLAATRKLGQAEDVYRRAFEAYERLTDEFPARPVYLDGLASACLNLSLMAAADGRTRERRSFLERAVTGFDELHAADENSVQYARGLALALAQLGHALHGSGGDARRTDEVLSRALEIGAALWDGNRDDADLRTALVWACNIRASARLKRGDAAAAAEAARVYVDLDPTPVELVWSASFLAGAVGVGQSTGASIDDLAAWTEEAVQLLDRAAGEAADDPLVRKEMVEPAFDAIADDERYRGLVELLGIRR